MNTLILSNGEQLSNLTLLAPAQVYFPAGAPFEALILEGVEVVNRIDADWPEVVVGDSVDASVLFPNFTSLPCVGMGNQLHQLPSRQGDVWYKLGVPSWRLATSSKRFVWGLFGANGLLKPASIPGCEWVLEPLARYLGSVGFVGPMGVWITRRRFSNFVVAIDYGRAYCQWITSDPLPKTTIKELISAQ